MGESGSTKISLQSKFVFTLKTIVTVAVTIIGIFWGYHEWVLDKRLSHIEEEVHDVELKIDKVYDHMIGIGGANENIESAEKPTEKENEGSL